MIPLTRLNRKIVPGNQLAQPPQLFTGRERTHQKLWRPIVSECSSRELQALCYGRLAKHSG